jgi:hypothetical protein
MSDLSDIACLACASPTERVRYFPRQMMTADDMRTEQEYWREKARRHNRFLHGWGVVCGCEVQALSSTEGWQVRVCPGYAVSPQGDEIAIDCCVDVDLRLGVVDPQCSVRWPCPPLGEMPGSGRDSRSLAYVAVRYAECLTRPMRVQPAGCDCDETGCEYSRIRDTFEIKVLWELPQSHARARQDDDAWCDALQKTSPDLMRRLHTYPVPPCPPCTTEPWVVLAQVQLPAQAPIASAAPAGLLISYLPRRALLSTQHLQVAALCLP